MDRSIHATDSAQESVQRYCTDMQIFLRLSVTGRHGKMLPTRNPSPQGEGGARDRQLGNDLINVHISTKNEQNQD